MAKLNENQIEELRRFLARELKYYNGKEHIKLNISSDILEQILFETYTNGCRIYLGNIFPMCKLDLSDVSFDGCDIINADFTGSQGAKMNPQTINNKNLSDTILTNVTFNGSFDGCNIKGANFAGSKGAVINPQKISNKFLFHTILEDVIFIGPFNDCIIREANFTGSKGAVINPQTVEKACHSGTSYKVCPTLEKTVLTDAIITGSFDGCYTKGMVFDGAVLSQVVGQIKEQIREQVRKRTL